MAYRKIFSSKYTIIVVVVVAAVYCPQSYAIIQPKTKTWFHIFFSYQQDVQICATINFSSKLVKFLKKSES